MCVKSVENLPEIAVDDPVERVNRKPDAVVGQAVLRKIVSANLVGPVTRAAQGQPVGADLRLLLAAAEVEYAPSV